MYSKRLWLKKWSNNGDILDKHDNYDKGIFLKNVDICDKCDKNSRVHGTEEQYCWKSISERFFKLLSVIEHLKWHIEIHLNLSICYTDMHKWNT